MLIFNEMIDGRYSAIYSAPMGAAWQLLAEGNRHWPSGQGDAGAAALNRDPEPSLNKYAGLVRKAQALVS